MANTLSRRSSDPKVPAVSWPAFRPAFFERWTPFRYMRNLFRGEPSQPMPPFRTPASLSFFPDFEVVETPQSYVFRADLPGIAKSDIDILVSGNQLTISGKREQERKEKNENCYCSERSYGAFTRSFACPQGAEMNRVTADYQNGVLTLTIPKSPESQPRKIEFGASTDNKKAARA